MLSKDKVKGFIMGIIICSLLSTFSFTVFAAPISKSIVAIFDTVKIIVDGVEKVPADDMKPFFYNGRTYVALRFAGEALGKKVIWDGANRKIFISDTGEIVKELREVYLYKKPFMESNASKYITVQDRNVEGNVYKDLYFKKAAPDGISEIKNNNGYYSSKYYVTYALNGLAKRLYGQIGCYSGGYEPYNAIFSFYDENDNLLFQSGMIKSTTDFVNVDIDVTNALQVKMLVEVSGEESGYIYKSLIYHISPAFSNIRILTTDY